MTKWNCAATFVAEQLDKLEDMTVSEKIKLIQDLLGVEVKEENINYKHASTDAVSRETYHNLVTASNDIDRALREYQDKEENGELVSVVRCKDCRHYKKINPRAKSGMCYKDIVASAWNDDGFCSRGERREL